MAALFVHLSVVLLSNISVPQSSLPVGKYKLDLSLVSVH